MRFVHKTIAAVGLAGAMLLPAVALEAHADTATTAYSAGTKTVGQTTYTWGSGAADSTVWTEVQIGTSWSRSQVGRTSANGSFSLPLTYGSTTVGTKNWRVGIATPSGTKYSSAFSLTRTAGVSAYSSGSKPVGMTTFTWGSLPGAANASVFTQVNLGGAWSTSQVGRTSSTGGFTLPLTYGANVPGTSTWRVGVRSASGTLYSKPFTLTRTGFSTQPCTKPGASESGLTATAVKTLRAVCGQFPIVGSYIGWRSWGVGGTFHNDGRAIDVMISGPAGWEIANWARANAKALGIMEVIYERRIWTTERSDEGWRWMSSRGNATADHYDHVHISVHG